MLIRTYSLAIAILIGGQSLSLCFASDSIVEQPSAQTAAERLHQIFNQEWLARLERSPLLASQLGHKQSDGLLDDASELAHRSWASKSEDFLKQLSAIEVDQLSAEDLINYQIFSQQLQRRNSEINYRSFQMPFLSDSGFHTEIMRLHNQTQLKTALDYRNFLKRLQQIPRYFQQHIDNMRNGLARNYSMPKIVMVGFSEVIESTYAKGWRSLPMWQAFETMPQSIPQADQQAIRRQAESILEQQVLPAFVKLAEFFSKEYIPKTKTSLAAYDFPDGAQYYADQVKHYTTLDLTAQQIHQIGLDEVARIRAEMEAIIKQVDFKGSFKDFLKFLREDPRFYAKSAQELIKQAAFIAKTMDGQLPRLFGKLPRQPYTVEAVPDAIAPKYTTGRYISAPIESDRAGIYWVNTYALDKRPLYVLEALTLHEAVPGHHLQNALNQELNQLPNFRRYSYISAFGEGWGLYSERLGLEAGFYQDPYSNFGRLTYEMWRAARLVIDTGIHAKGWSREQAINLLQENSALSTHNIRTEVDRYISWPGQALSYKLGELKIRQLRKRAEDALKDNFDLRSFHDEILKNGSIPLDVLEQQIDEFIKSRL